MVLQQVFGKSPVPYIRALRLQPIGCLFMGDGASASHCGKLRGTLFLVALCFRPLYAFVLCTIFFCTLQLLEDI